MTTPTKDIVALVTPHACSQDMDGCDFTWAGIQAFREAVEAEYESERMKQPAILWVDMHEVEKLRSRSLPVRCIHEQYDADYSPLYAKPFPSTEQLQQRVKELEAAITMALLDVEGDEWIDVCKKALANTQGDSK